jgi:hypothetical protein
MKRRALLVRGLIAAAAVATCSHAPIVQAEIVDTDAMSAPTQADQDRATVQQFIDSATVKDRLQALGVSGVLLESRLAALSPAEIHALAQRIDTMPAGGSFSDSQVIIILLLCILVAIIV